MFKKADPARLRLMRGVILQAIYMASMSEALNPDDPDTIGRTVLVITLEQLAALPTEPELHGCLRYLESKGYLSVAWSHDGTGSFERATITSAGKDLVEHTTRDAGVTLSSRRS